jgi:hypothetical protein
MCFIVFVSLCVVYCFECCVLVFVMYVILCYVIVVPLPPGINPLAVINNIYITKAHRQQSCGWCYWASGSISNTVGWKSPNSRAISSEPLHCSLSTAAIIAFLLASIAAVRGRRAFISAVGVSQRRCRSRRRHTFLWMKSTRMSWQVHPSSMTSSNITGTED